MGKQLDNVIELKKMLGMNKAKFFKSAKRQREGVYFL